MEQFLSGIPTTFTGWLASLIVVVGGIFLFWGKKRSGDLETLRATNRDQGDRINLLEEAVERLQVEVKELKHQNKTLEDLVVVALKQFFFENPKLAKDINEKLIS